MPHLPRPGLGLSLWKRLPVRFIPGLSVKTVTQRLFGPPTPIEQPTSQGNYGDGGGGGSAIDGPPRMASWFESCASRR